MSEPIKPVVIADQTSGQTFHAPLPPEPAIQTQSTGGNQSMKLLLPVVIVAILAGTGTGYALSQKLTVGGKTSPTSTQQTQTTDKTQALKVGDVYGSKDAATFKDGAEGVLLPGGANGEGSYHIVREGGESQNVYLTSSIVDLGLFVNHKVAVRGETFQAQRAGWLMDVGQVKVLELNAALPAWAQKAAEKQEKSAGNQ